MLLAGVADVVTDYRVQTAVELNVPLLGATEYAAAAMREAGLAPFGTRVRGALIAGGHAAGAARI